MVSFTVSLPVTVKAGLNCPVTKHEPAGIGEVDAMGLGTVVVRACLLQRRMYLRIPNILLPY